MTGIILIFSNREDYINKVEFTMFIEEHPDIHLCLVNNGSTDNTISLLQELEHRFPESICVIDLKVKRDHDFALRNGFRLLMRSKNIDKVNYGINMELNDLKATVDFGSNNT
ncbi:MAG: glycosyltransferase [Leeuwenhoekiella sp.]